LQDNITIDAPISKSTGSINIKMTCENQDGKVSTTHIQPLKFNEQDDTTLVEAIPVTGRQHQIRVHLDSIGHTIVGDPIYGVDDQTVNQCLKKTLSDEQRIELTGAKRLMLHANKLSFNYQGVRHNITSILKDLVFK